MLTRGGSDRRPRMAQGVTRHLTHAHPKHRSSIPSGAPRAPGLSVLLVLFTPGQPSGVWRGRRLRRQVPLSAVCPRAALAGPADPLPGARLLLPPHTLLAPAEGQALPSMDMGSRMPNCLRTAMNSSTTTAMAHSSMPWMPMATRAARGRGLPLARACLGRRRGPCSPPGLLGSPRLTSPGRRGCGCRRGPGPAEGGGGGELGRPGGRTRHGGRAGAQLSESAAKLRGAAARSAGRAAGVGQRRLHGRRGRRASFAPSPAPRARGHAGAAAGVPGAPGRPSLHRGSPRAHWPRRGDHPGRRPLRRVPPPTPRPARAREGAEGGGPAPRGPAPGQSLAPSHRHPASPREAARSAVSPNCPCRVGAEWLGKGPGTGGEKSRSLALREESGLQTPG